MSFIEEGSAADMLRRDFAAAVRRPEFWVFVLRETVPVFGVLFFGWMAFQAAVFFLLESWLFVSVRATTAVLFDPKGANHQVPAAGLARYFKLAVYYAVGALAIAFPVGVMGFLSLVLAFSDEHWDAFYLDGVDGPFLAGLAVLLASEIYAGRRLHRRLVGGGSETPEERRRLRGVFERCAAVFACMALAGQVAGPGRVGGVFFVAAVALVAIFFEAVQNGPPIPRGESPTPR